MSKTRVRSRDKLANKEHRKLHRLLAKAVKTAEQRHLHTLLDYYGRNN